MTKQRIASVRLYSRILRIQEGRIQRKIFRWADTRRKGLNAKVRNIINSENGLDLVTSLQLSQKHVMKQMESNLKMLDNQEWPKELFNDRNNQIREISSVHIVNINQNANWSHIYSRTLKTPVTYRLYGEQKAV